MNTVFTFDDISPDYVSVFKLKKLITFLNDININATLFIIPNSNGQFPLDEAYISTLKFAIKTGHEIAQHGYRHGNPLKLGVIPLKSEFGSILPIPWPSYEKQINLFTKGKILIKEKIGQNPVGFRAPSYITNKITFKILKELGYSYDSSKTLFKPTQNLRFRFRTFNSAKLSIIEGIKEIPVTGDYTHNLTYDNFFHALKRAINDFKLVKKMKGIFVVNVHIQNLDIQLKFIRKLNEKLSKNTKFFKLQDIAEN